MGVHVLMENLSTLENQIGKCSRIISQFENSLVYEKTWYSKGEIEGVMRPPNSAFLIYSAFTRNSKTSAGLGMFGNTVNSQKVEDIIRKRISDRKVVNVLK